MDRFVVKEPRVGAGYPQGNQMISYASNPGSARNMVGSNVKKVKTRDQSHHDDDDDADDQAPPTLAPTALNPETMYFGGYGAEFPMPHTSGFMTMTHVNAPFVPNHPSQPGPSSVMSGIDPRYLAAFADENAEFIASQRQQMKRVQTPLPPNGAAFASDYDNRNFIAPDRRLKTFTSQMASSSNASPQMSPQQLEPPKPSTPISPRNIYASSGQEHHQNNSKSLTPLLGQVKTAKTPSNEDDIQKSQIQLQVKTRADKLRELQKSGPRAFSGPVEKIIKWHKALQDLGVLVLYEIVAKCVSIRPGESCAKNLVVRDDNGPAMQVVYYEIDFLLPALKPPCTVRVVGRMLAGTSRLQAFSVRAATGDDVNTLPRRAAVAAHHVSKLCKEYGHP